MAVQYEVPDGDSLLIKGPANVIIKAGAATPLIGNSDDLPQPPDPPPENNPAQPPATE